MTHARASASAEADLARDKRLNEVGWALFLILTGVTFLLPESQVPPGTWLLGTGFLLLGLNAVRAITKLPVSGFTTLLGALAVAAGLSQRWDFHVPLVAIGLILLGTGLLARQLVGRAGR